MRTLKLATFCLTCTLPLSAFAEPEAPRKAAAAAQPHVTASREIDRPLRVINEMSPEERAKFYKDLEQFCQDHAPIRWREVKNKTQGRPMNGMAVRFLNLQRLEKENKDLYDIKVREIEIEDDEFDLLLQRKRAKGNRLNDIDAKLQEKSREFVELRHRERATRIAHLQKMIEQEKQALAADQRNSNDLIERHFNNMVNEGLEFFSPKPAKRDEGAFFSPEPPKGDKSPGGGN